MPEISPSFPFKVIAAIIPPIFACAFAAAAEKDAPGAPRTLTLSVHRATAYVEIADTPALRRAGFSHRARPAADSGILFVFDAPQRFCLWMRDVSFPLDAAFINAKGKIIAAARMSPRTETKHCPPRPAKYALELNAGWLQKNKVRVGDKINGLPPAAAPAVK